MLHPFLAALVFVLCIPIGLPGNTFRADPGKPEFQIAPGALRRIPITVDDKGWSDTRPQDIQVLLESAARTLLSHVPHKNIDAIRVIHSSTAPVTHFERGANGEYVIELTVANRRWDQFTYQFAHECCHILSNYERNNENHVGRENQWFDESLCEMASVFTLRQLAVIWNTSPPYPNWKSYTPHLREYADNVLKQKARQLPAGMSLAEWFAANRSELRNNPYLREKNGIVAAALLPLFEAHPEHWEAVTYLNLGKPDAANSFENYLENWYFSVPARHKTLVQQIADMLGVRCPAIADRIKP
jgi:hypothetical protein